MDFTKIFDLKYIFTQNPAPLHPFQRNVLIAVFGILIVVAVISALWGRRKKLQVTTKKIASKISTSSFIMGLVGWLLFFLRQKNVYFFNRRLWLVFWFIAAVVWLFYLLKYIFKKAPLERQEIKKRQEFEKYLPQRRK